MNICEHLTVAAKLFPDKVAVVFEQTTLTYVELDRLSQSAAEMLRESGITRGDRVAIMLPNVPAFIVWYYAAVRLGAIAVSISSRLAPSELDFLVSDCDARVFVCLEETSDAIRDQMPECVDTFVPTNELGKTCHGLDIRASAADESILVDCEPNEPAVILYTSGTTGFAKGATLSHMNVRSNVAAFNHLCEMRPHDRMLLAVPLFHCFGQNALLNSAFNVGATLVMQRKFDPLEAKQLIMGERITQLYGVPMMFQVFLDTCEPEHLATVNYCFSAAATLPIQTSQRWQEKFGMPIFEGYGLTETSPFACYNHRLKFTPGSIGMPVDGVEMRIIDTDSGHRCPPGNLGEIAIRGPNVMLGYWNRPEDTSQAIRAGWFYSGDIGKQDENGFFYIVDRVKDMIAVGGLKVYPAEVERILLDHPAVSQAAVVGFPDNVFGESVIAFVVLVAKSGPGPTGDDSDPADQQTLDADGHSWARIESDILQHAQDNLANYKVPRQIIRIDELPRNPSGKVLKTKLRKMEIGIPSLRGGAQSPDSDPCSVATSQHRSDQTPTLRERLQQSHAASRRDIANQFVQRLVQTITNSSEIAEVETRFLDAGLDSLMVVEMSGQIQREVGPEREIPSTLVFDHPRICDLGEFLLQTILPSEETIVPQPNSSSTNESGTKPDSGSSLETEIAQLSEEQALKELIKELEA